MGSNSWSTSSYSTDYIENVIERLRVQSLRDSTRELYHKIWCYFNEFLIKLDRKPESWEDRLILFIGNALDEEKESTTLKTYASAIRSVLREDGIELDPNIYALTALTQACKLKNYRVKTRLPIGKNLLRMLLDQFEIMFQYQSYLEALYKAILVIGYYGLFRIGELVFSPHSIKAVDVHSIKNKKIIQIVLRTSKLTV